MFLYSHYLMNYESDPLNLTKKCSFGFPFLSFIFRSFLAECVGQSDRRLMGPVVNPNAANFHSSSSSQHVLFQMKHIQIRHRDSLFRNCRFHVRLRTQVHLSYCPSLSGSPSPLTPSRSTHPVFPEPRFTTKPYVKHTEYCRPRRCSTLLPREPSSGLPPSSKHRSSFACPISPLRQHPTRDGSRLGTHVPAIHVSVCECL
jgi:hypothetical protein